MAISEQQQQINMNKFKIAQERARKLISMDAKQELAEGKRPKNLPTLQQSMGMPSSNSFNDMYEDEIEEPQYLSEAQVAEIHKQAKQQPIQQTMVRNSKLPNVILESMTTKPIDTSVLEGNMGMERQTSVLDSIGIQPKPTKQRINEQQTVQLNQQVPQPTSNIDYSLIKTIVEDCMKKNISALKKSILNESKQITETKEDNLVLMKIGESFKFVTSSGDIFEAKLVKKGNVHDKK